MGGDALASRLFDTTHWAIPPPSQLVSRHASHLVTRRTFIGSVAGVAGAAASVGMFPATVLAKESNSTPRPTTNTQIVGGVTFDVTFFGPGIDPSSIWDFNGLVGVAEVQGTGTATNPDGSKETLLFDTDMRFMSGAYVGLDGRVHKGTFGFV
jgi:hypothetical protein